MRRTRRTALVLALVLCLSVLVSAIPRTAARAERAASHAGLSILGFTLYPDIQYRYYYNQLSLTEKRVYNTLVNELPKFPKTIQISDSVNEDSLLKIYDAVRYDNPEFFFLGLKCSYKRNRLVRTVTPSYVLSKKTYESQLKAVNQAADRLLKNLPQNASDYEKELYVYNKLGTYTKYSNSGTASHGPYGALVRKQSNCEGYARTLQLLLNRAGVVNHVVPGKAIKRDGSRPNHMWNVVTVGGQDYCADLTWDDYDRNFAGGDTKALPSHYYFNRSAEVFRKDHLPTDSAAVRTCTSDNANYFRRNSLYYTSYNADTKRAIQSKLKAALKNGDDSFEVMFAASAWSAAKKDLATNGRLLAWARSSGARGGRCIATEKYKVVRIVL